MYTPGKNQKADALTRREQDVITQDQVKTEARIKSLLTPDQIDPRIQEELQEPFGLCALESYKQETLVDQILQANCTTDSFDQLRRDAQGGSPDYTLQDGLLFYKDRIVIPDQDHLCTKLI